MQLNRFGAFLLLVVIFACCQDAAAQWRGTAFPPGDNFRHSVGFWTPADRHANLEWIMAQEQLDAGFPLGVTIVNGDLINNYAIGVMIEDSPGAHAENNAPVSAQTNTRGSKGSIENKTGPVTTNYTIDRPFNPCWEECR